MQHLFILNPAAGKRDRSALLKSQIQALCEARGLEYQIAITTCPGHATELARAAAQTGAPVRIYACGGDGTLNEAINGMYGYPNAAITSFCCGSGNDFVRLFSDPAAFRDLERLLDADEACFDLVRVNDRFSIGICSAGIDARIAYAIPRYRRLPLVTGSGAYALSIVNNLIHRISRHFRIRIQDRSIDEELTLLCVCNGRWYGGGYCPVPTADPADGILDVLLVKAVSRLQAVQILGEYKVGHYAQFPDQIEHFRCTSLELDCDEPTVVNLDGEALITNHVTFSVEPQKLRFFYPKGLTW